MPNCAFPNGRSNQGAITKVQPTTNEESKYGGGDFEDCVCRNLCASDLGLGLVQLTEEESMEDDFPMDRSSYDEGRFRSGVPRVEGNVQSVVGMSIGGTGNECNSEESFEATGMDLEGGGKALISY